MQKVGGTAGRTGVKVFTGVTPGKLTADEMTCLGF